MKKSLLTYALFAATLSLLSCSKQHPSTPAAQEKAVTVTFSVGDQPQLSYGTKAGETHTENEAKINSYQILVFNPDGSLNAYGSTTGNGSCSIKLTTGNSLKCYAVVNMPDKDLSSIRDLASLQAVTSDIKNNGAASFHMMGNVIRDIDGDSAIEIPVSRFASKITLERITKHMSSAALEALEFKVKGVYLVNVRGAISLGGEQQNTWYNKITYSADDNANTLMGTNSLSKVLGSEAWDCNLSSYAYPNSVSQDSNAATFGPRFTRLVVEASIGDKTYYYPVNMFKDGQGLEANKHYKISGMTITGVGASSPDEQLVLTTITFSLSVNDWGNGFSQTVEY